MARKKVSAPQPYGSWDEADEALREIGELQRSIEAAEHEMQRLIDAAKEQAGEATQANRLRISELEQRLNAFADSRLEEFAKAKTRELTFGFIGFRKSTKLTLPRGGKLAELMRKLKEMHMADCIIYPEPKIDKEALKKYPPGEILAAGAGLEITDNFWYETKREEIVG
jgi:phage host-nuclease inhibitor protein Gam